MSSQPIRNNGRQPLDFGWNDGEGNTLSPGVAKWTEWKPRAMGGHLCYPKERDTEQNKANKEKIRAKKWRQIHNLFIFTPQARTFQFSHMHESREKTVTNHQVPINTFLPAFFVVEVHGEAAIS